MTDFAKNSSTSPELLNGAINMFFQLRLESIIMPKYLIQYSLFNCLSLILRQKLRLCTFFCGGWNITKFDLSMFRDNLLAQSQV